MPKTRVSFWEEKIRRNKARDASNIRKLRRMGWNVLVVRECSMKDFKLVAERVVNFLRG